MLSAPEAIGDIFKLTIGGLAIETLIGGGTVQGSQMTDKRTDFDIVKVGLFDDRRHTQSATIPSHLELWIGLVDILRQQIDTLWVGIAAHKRDTGDIIAEALYEIIERFGIQRKANVFPEILAMAAWAAAWTATDIDGQGYFVGYLLKDNACVYVFQHVPIAIAKIYFLPFYFSFCGMGVEATGSLFLTWLREVAHSLQIANDTGHIVHIL